MGLTIEPVDATLGAVVTGVRLASLDEPTWSEIEAAFHEYAVLVFPGQRLSSGEQKAFGRHFGELEDLSGGRAEPGLTPISNQKADGTLLDPEHPVSYILRGNEGWHTDSSYMPLAAKASMLSAHVLPSRGGTTEWADMRAAYDALPVDLRERVDALSAHHSLEYSQAKVGQTGVSSDSGMYGFHGGPAPLRPLVKIHPATGRPSLFIGRHAHAIPGLSDEESEQLLDQLMTFACQPPRVYEHRWQVGDIVVWDNRCVLHRARPWDPSEARVMKHTRISGDPATEAALVP
jgi:alpha-ketoglutarate-dependent taurine dioxygenase